MKKKFIQWNVWEGFHVSVTITLDSVVAAFYTKVAQQANLPLEQVLSDTLFKLAAELSLESLQKKSL